MVGIDVISKYLSLQCPFPYQSSRLLYHIYPISQVVSKSSNDVESNRESNKVPIYCFILVGYFDQLYLRLSPYILLDLSSKHTNTSSKCKYSSNTKDIKFRYLSITRSSGNTGSSPNNGGWNKSTSKIASTTNIPATTFYFGIPNTFFQLIDIFSLSLCIASHCFRCFLCHI